MKKKKDDLRELLELLRGNPNCVKQLILDPENIPRLLKRKAARGLLSANVADFLDYIASADDGHPIAHCRSKTGALCAKGTRYAVKCGGGTQTAGG